MRAWSNMAFMQKPVAASETTMPDDPTASRPPSGSGSLRSSLSGKLLVLTASFVLLAELLIFPPSAANFRANWLEEKLRVAAAAGVVLLEADELSAELRDAVLETTGTQLIALYEDDMKLLLAGLDNPQPIDELIALEDARDPIPAMLAAFDTILFGGDRFLGVVGTPSGTERTFEIVVADRMLREELLAYSRNIALLSLLISAITAGLVFLVLRRLMIEPIRAMMRSMISFGRSPEDIRAVIQPSGRTDEIGRAERELSTMQIHLNRTLGQQRRLADLGLAVSKINHDMRNVLTVAQILGDRLNETSDPSAKRFAPRLLEALTRAIAYTQSVMDYGRATERPPNRRTIRLHDVVEEVHSVLSVEAEDVEFVNEVRPDLEIDADPEHLFRVINNLTRNAAQALQSDEDRNLVRRITIAGDLDDGRTWIEVADTGPGLPRKAIDNLFSAFRGGARSGGTGLGLAIAQELVRAHGGIIELVESRPGRTCFRIELPQQDGVAGAPDRGLPSGDKARSPDPRPGE